MLASLLLAVAFCAMPTQQEIFALQSGCKPRQISFENPTGLPGSGGRENKGAKGHPMQDVKPGEAVTLMDYAGTGVIRHIWLTIPDRDAVTLRAIKVEMFWDGSPTPAVSAPLGDFFGTGLAVRLPFENAFFSDPEGRSFNCTIPMPFRKHARIVLTNESTKSEMLFYSISFTEEKDLASDSGYFHACWRRMQATELGKDYEILPHVRGKGRFLGSDIGVIANPLYGDSWFGEGEVKMYLDGDQKLPTLNGTGTEDYIGTAWGQGKFIHSSSGCTVSDSERGRYAFYKFHIADPIFFDKDCRVTIQVMGGAPLQAVRAMRQRGAALIPVTVQPGQELIKLLEQEPAMDLADAKFPDGWVNFYRSDDYSSTAYFYLDKPGSELPALAPPSDRTQKM